MKFSEIPGHEEAKARMRQMVEQGRLPHALLISAPVGSGEVMLARAFAQFIHCTGRQPGDTDSCGRCPSCRQHESFNHVDLHFSFPVLKKGSGDATISDDYIREWRDLLGRDPWMDLRQWPALLGKPDGQPLIYVHEADHLQRVMSLTARSSNINITLMWLPERLKEEAANGLLKLVEEPEEGSMFIMVSNSPADVLPTIYSRCQRIELRRLPDSAVAGVLQAQGASESDAIAAARIADGNVIAARDALNQMGGGADRQLDFFMQLMRLAYARKVGELKQWSEKVAELKRDGICRFLDYCQRLVRENFIMNLHVDPLNAMTPAEQQFSSRFCPFINERNVERLIEELDSAMTDIRGNASAKIVLFDLAVKTIVLLKA